MCGEKSRCGTFALQIPGSPPRVRGKAFRDRQVNGFDGITPAYAGKRLLHTSGDIRGWDHPRVCGEKMVSMIPHRRSRGSPPRVRGKGPCKTSPVAYTGITPACAGKSQTPAPCCQSKEDHPRVCGEKITLHIRAKVALGSPPRMRGKGPLPRNALPALGITPAYAGKSLWSGSVRVWVWDHPRVCGEKVAVCHDHASGVGSPPRMRGKGQALLADDLRVGITPACAGKRRRPA